MSEMNRESHADDTPDSKYALYIPNESGEYDGTHITSDDIGDMRADPVVAARLDRVQSAIESGSSRFIMTALANIRLLG